MINYQNGKIYAIKSYQTELIYIGSTTRPLSQRLGVHRNNYKNNTGISSMELLKYSDYYIELIENFPCNSKEELLKREGYFIKQNINNCVNCCIAGRTQKEYRNDNLEKIKEWNKQNYLNNAEQYKEHQKQYRLNNKEQIKEHQKHYCLNNVEKIKEKQKEYRLNNVEKRKQYLLDNAERIKEQQKQYNQKRKELKQLKKLAKTEETNISEN